MVIASLSIRSIFPGSQRVGFPHKIHRAGGRNQSWDAYHVVSSVATALNHQKKALNGARIMLLGVAYKKDIDDLRESPALTIIELLQKGGAEVEYNDPYIPFDR